jgi:hypothetical protein
VDICTIEQQQWPQITLFDEPIYLDSSLLRAVHVESGNVRFM